jgi:hypothetical protein
MSFKVKAISLSVCAVLVAAGGAYSFMSDSPQNATTGTAASAPVQPVAQSAEPQAPKSGEVAVDNPAGADVTGSPAAVGDKPVVNAPKKLTREQLMPPPETAEEKLQKAAQQESNF